MVTFVECDVCFTSVVLTLLNAREFQKMEFYLHCKKTCMLKKYTIKTFVNGTPVTIPGTKILVCSTSE